MRAKLKLKISIIEKMKPMQEIWDSDVSGLHVRALKRGKYFYLYYRNEYGDQRRPALGKYGAITLHDAREKARYYLSEISKGNDPSIDKRKLKSIDHPTMHDLRKKWEAEHASHLKSYRSYVRIWDLYITPVLGDRRVKDITKRDVMYLLSQVPYKHMSNTVRSVLSKSFSLAEEWDWREDNTNPVSKIKKFPENSRNRYLKPHEMERLGTVLKKWSTSNYHFEVSFADLIRLLLITGARRSEIMKAKWTYIDWHREVLILPDSKTGEKEIVLPTNAIDYLSKMYDIRKNDWIIPGRRINRHLTAPFKFWKRMCLEAQLENLHIHDLRHCFASTALSSAGGTLPQVGNLLGHKQAQTTLRYAHFMTAPKKELADKTARIISGWLG